MPCLPPFGFRPPCCSHATSLLCPVLLVMLQPEQLSEEDSWYCPKCKDHVQVSVRSFPRDSNTQGQPETCILPGNSSWWIQVSHKV